MGSMAKLATPRFRFCQSFQVSSGDGIFRCENAIFNEIEERVPEFFSDAFQITWNAFGTRSERVRNAFGTRSGRVPNANGTRTHC